MQYSNASLACGVMSFCPPEKTPNEESELENRKELKSSSHLWYLTNRKRNKKN
jgi:hypothetical protein